MERKEFAAKLLGNSFDDTWRGKAIDAMFNELQSGEYAVISYEVEAQRSPDGVVYRATLVIRAKGNADEERYVDLLRENPDVTVERIV